MHDGNDNNGVNYTNDDDNDGNEDNIYCHNDDDGDSGIIGQIC